MQLLALTLDNYHIVKKLRKEKEKKKKDVKSLSLAFKGEGHVKETSLIKRNN